MRRAILVVICLAMLISLATGHAWATDYGFRAKYHTYYGQGELGFILGIAAEPWYTDGYDGWSSDTPMDLSWPAPQTMAAIYKTYGTDGWDGSTGYYWGDMRGPIPAGAKKVFDNIYFWAMPGTPAGDISISAGAGYIRLDIGLTYELSLVSIPQGITYGGPREWTTVGGAPPPPAAVLPYYATDDPSTGYKFRVEVTAIPEPSSLLALACGLAGVGGLVARRRGR